MVTVVSLFGSQGLDSIIGGGGGDQGGVGSGFVVSRDGEIATNAHVVTTGEGDEIKRANQLYVEFADGNQVEAKIVGYDPNADIALLKVDPQGLTLRPLPLAQGQTRCRSARRWRRSARRSARSSRCRSASCPPSTARSAR